MNPTIRKLPKNVQSLICASNQINCYTKAVQELVFNALDADATSIAVRIHIAEGTIQVVDNGYGISQADFKHIGQNYMTSKLVDISTLRSAPNKYGFQGQSLANIAQISETMKVTSRFHKSDSTCVKIFENGKVKSIAKCSVRPSKGTTIEVKGYLYNLCIQNKSVDVINELQNIKTILEHISLVHSSISLSLRDDSKNEIVYKIHKNRDMYQTLSSLYEIEKASVQELHVEKNQYKVKAFVGNRDVEINRQSIFLNGKFIADSSVLYTKVKENFKKYLNDGKKKINKKVFNDEENFNMFGNKIPLYFIFITCPYMDYELTNTVLEFKDWEQINTILVKLVKFYIGDTQLQEVPIKRIARFGDKKHNTESNRSQIAKIIHKVLGNHYNKSEISHMQKGVKGKLIRRKAKNKKDLSINVADAKKCNNRKNTSKLLGNIPREKTLSAEEDPYKINSNLKIQTKTCNKTNKNGHSSETTTSETAIKKKYRNQAKLLRKRKENSKKKTQKPLNRNDRKKTAKQNERTGFRKISLNSKFAMETESVKKTCEILARKTEELIFNRRNPATFIDENCQYTHSNFITGNKNIAIETKVNEFVMHEFIPLPPKFGNRVGNNGNKEQFKSNYDLLQIIINSQQESYKHDQFINVKDGPMQNLVESNFNHLHKELTERNHVPLVRELNNQGPFQGETPDSRLFIREREIEPVKRLHKDSFELLQISKYNNPYETDTPDNIINKRPSIGKPDDIASCLTATTNSNIRPYLMRTSNNTSPFHVFTFQSHNYVEQDFESASNVERYNVYEKPRNFITTQSRENFIDFQKSNRPKTSKINLNTKLFQTNNKRKINKTMKMFDIENNTFKDIQESCTIKFTESNDERTFNGRKYIRSLPSTNQNSAGSISKSYHFNNSQRQYTLPKDSPWLIARTNREKDSELLNENILMNSYKDSHFYLSSNILDAKNDKTYTIDSTNKCGYQCSNIEHIEHQTINDNNNTNISVSKSQENVGERLITDPIDVCETVFIDQELSTDGVREFDSSFHCIQASGNNNIDAIDTRNLPKEITDENQHLTKPQNQEEHVNTSHHFTIPQSNICVNQRPMLIQKQGPVLTAHHIHKTTSNELDYNDQQENVVVFSETANEKNDTRAFQIRNRMIFVPKGMSPIFNENHTKNNCEHNPIEDYYEDKIYNEFVDKIEKNTEVLKPKVQDSSDINAKDKANNKMNKGNASLKFDGLCIKNAKVLGQIDSKFIAAVMKSKSHETDALEEFLVLFDQHAVHERIRLENNLADYLIGSQWKSVTIDEVCLKMSRDEILCLHNYRDKFTQFGLDWNILNYNHVSITAIPEGILGKNPRQVDKIMKAVKSLITEEMNIIQMQRGCVSQYPKSIMDLVFSEACRYAIKFGDHLSKSRCVELLHELSDCKTPFQCAHGRPSMAVIMNIERHQPNHEINYKHLENFLNPQRKTSKRN